MAPLINCPVHILWLTATNTTATVVFVYYPFYKRTLSTSMEKKTRVVAIKSDAMTSSIWLQSSRWLRNTKIVNYKNHKKRSACEEDNVVYEPQ